MKKSILILLTIVLVISLIGCGSTTTEEPAEEVKLLSSEDLPYDTALIHRQEEDAFEIPLISWEFVNEDMIRIIGQRQSVDRDGNLIRTTNYDFLIHKINVTLFTMDRIDE